MEFEDLHWIGLGVIYQIASNLSRIIMYHQTPRQLNVVFPRDLYWVHSYFLSISMILPIFVSTQCQYYLLMILIDS